MQIKNNFRKKNKQPQSLMNQWLAMILPFIAGILFLPYLFILLSRAYLVNFPPISMEMLLIILGIQGLLTLCIPILTAGILLHRISRQLNTVANVLSDIERNDDRKGLLSDDWLTLEKQENYLGQSVILIKKILKHNQSDESLLIDESVKTKKNILPSTNPIETLFCVSVQEPNSQRYYSLY